jgi:DNA polymerase III delta prime subunit
MRWIDFGAYSRNYLLPHFLPVIPSSENNPQPSYNLPTDVRSPLDTVRYEQTLRLWVRDEAEAQADESGSYALFGHQVEVRNLTSSATFIISVPGLRENTPFVEEDDVVQLRPLVFDHLGRVLGMGVTTNAGFCSNIIYNGRVSTVLRSKEMLHVTVHGHTLPTSMRLRCNIQFLVPPRRHSPLLDVLPLVREGLREQQLLNNNGDTNGSSMPHVQDGITTPSLSQSWLRRMLFPTDNDGQLQTRLNTVTMNRAFFDPDLNWEQLKAVQSIAKKNFGSLPFLISGPPGTGKTKTIIEAALQLVNHVAEVKHILLCAPSDPAADILARRLRPYFGPRELLRLNRPTRTFAEVPEEILPYCYVGETMFTLPPLPQLMAYRVVITTCRDASMLMHARLSNSDLFAVEDGVKRTFHPLEPESDICLHWSALLLDEAAQATEPEALIPLWVVAPPKTTRRLTFTPLVVMAGDQHQLGPRTSLVSSPLRTSLFGRLFARPVYANHPLARDRAAPRILDEAMLPMNRPAFANLVNNYRSHPAILAVPSHLFYADSLEPEGNDTKRLNDWQGWPRPGWPIIFHHNTSLDDQERDGGGWFNTGEVRIVTDYVSSLLEARNVDPREICVMSPFRGQVRLLRKAVGYGRGVNVGPCEAFQGLESGVVILCITRTRVRFLEHDRKMGWGIIDRPNLMNVALTRAKFGLIVIGNREVMKQDKNWQSFVAFCDRNGLVVGNNDSGSEDGGDPDHNGNPDGAVVGGEEEGDIDNEAQHIFRLEQMLRGREQDAVNQHVMEAVFEEEQMRQMANLNL